MVLLDEFEAYCKHCQKFSKLHPKDRLWIARRGQWFGAHALLSDAIKTACASLPPHSLTH
jgi:hypothetical protein